ncbi:hypothetical protein [uncultured Clostridium sp.]|uniref:hypothetical protein n=1 Tax=uncultured Clostridium sp. TaxID=59620 RepID=UPI002624667A|nr:hypothetical protein [uncultured Clostridium sp.]
MKLNENLFESTEPEMYRGTKVKLIYHGDWNDPELVYNGRSYNYYDVENALWNDYINDNYIDPIRVDPSDIEIDEEFTQYVQEHVYDLLNSLNESLNEDIDDSILDKAYNGSYYTIIGAGGDINEWKEGYQKLLDEHNIGTIKEWITFKGSDMNNKYGLTGDNAYPNDLTFLAFCLDGLDINKLAIFKIKMQDRWFDDIVDNNNSNREKDLIESCMPRMGKKLNESVNSSDQVKAILNQYVDNGRVRALRDDEKLPRGFSFKSGNGTAGQVSYNGIDYVYALVNDKLKVMTSREAGDNWSQTIYKEDLTKFNKKWIEGDNYEYVAVKVNERIIKKGDKVGNDYVTGFDPSTNTVYLDEDPNVDGGRDYSVEDVLSFIDRNNHIDESLNEDATSQDIINNNFDGVNDKIKALKIGQEIAIKVSDTFGYDTLHIKRTSEKDYSLWDTNKNGDIANKQDHSTLNNAMYWANKEFVSLDANQPISETLYDLSHNEDERLQQLQGLVDNAVELFGRVPASFYDDFDEIGFYIEQQPGKGKFTVKKKEPTNESFEDEHLGTKSEIESAQLPKQSTENNGLASIVNNLIQDE